MSTAEPALSPSEVMTRWASLIYTAIYGQPAKATRSSRADESPPAAHDIATALVVSAAGPRACVRFLCTDLEDDDARRWAALRQGLASAGVGCSIVPLEGAAGPQRNTISSAYATGAAGWVRIDAPAPWALSLPFPPPDRGETFEVRISAPAPPCDGAIFPLPSPIRANVLIGGLVVGGQLALDGEDLWLTLGAWSTEARACAPDHIWATFAASVRRVEGARVSIHLAPSAPLNGTGGALHWVRADDRIGLRADLTEVETQELSR